MDIGGKASTVSGMASKSEMEGCREPVESARGDVLVGDNSDR